VTIIRRPSVYYYLHLHFCCIFCFRLTYKIYETKTQHELRSCSELELGLPEKTQRINSRGIGPMSHDLQKKKKKKKKKENGASDFTLIEHFKYNYDLYSKSS